MSEEVGAGPGFAYHVAVSSAFSSIDRRRRFYLVASGLGTGSAVITWLIHRHSDAYIALTFPVLTVFLVGVTIALARSAGLVRIGRIVYWFLLIEWLGGAAWNGATTTVALKGVLLMMLAHLAFPTRAALKASLVLVLGSTGLGLAQLYFFPSFGEAAVALGALVRAEVLLALIAIFMHLLARSKEDRATAEAEARQYRDAAYQDVLTGLPNRRALEEIIDRESERANRTGQPLSVLMCDIDQFKSVNDTHGHDQGDVVLQKLAAAVAPTLRSTDVLGRWGGEEFLLIAPATAPHAAEELAERLRVKIQEREFGGGLDITASFGVAGFRPGESRRELLRRADEMLYRAKRAGRNRTEVDHDAAPELTSANA